MNQRAIPAGTIYPGSIIDQDGVVYFLCKLNANGAHRLGVIGEMTGLVGAEASSAAQLYPCSAEHAAVLRERLSWLRPVRGTRKSYDHGSALRITAAQTPKLLIAVAAVER